MNAIRHNSVVFQWTNYVVEFPTVLDNFYWLRNIKCLYIGVEGGEVGYNVHKTETHLRTFCKFEDN